MLGKLCHFLFSNLLLLLFTSFVKSKFLPEEVNLQLQTNLSCSAKNDSCDKREFPRSFCNSAGKCQCNFGYTPSASGMSCEPFHCVLPIDCKQLYNDRNASCDNYDGSCSCAYGYSNQRNNKCGGYNEPTFRLGEHCVADHQCGHNAQCTVDGECRCPAGYVPASDYTCAHPRCSSDDFCHTKVTPNTVCEDNQFCTCVSPYTQQNNETFECVRLVPEVIKLGAHCGNSTGSDCGEGADCTSGSEQVCKCRLGYEATSDTVCEVVHCGRDEHCHKNVSPLTDCIHAGDRERSFCRCKKDYYESPETFTCWKQADNIGDQHGGDY